MLLLLTKPSPFGELVELFTPPPFPVSSLLCGAWSCRCVVQYMTPFSSCSRLAPAPVQYTQVACVHAIFLFGDFTDLQFDLANT